METPLVFTNYLAACLAAGAMCNEHQELYPIMKRPSQDGGFKFLVCKADEMEESKQHGWVDLEDSDIDLNPLWTLEQDLRDMEKEALGKGDTKLANKFDRWASIANKCQGN